MKKNPPNLAIPAKVLPIFCRQGTTRNQGLPTASRQHIKTVLQGVSLIAIACVALMAAGCASAPAKFYTLGSVAKGDVGAVADCAIMVGSVSVPAAVDRPQFTVEIAPNRVVIDEYNRWAEPLGEGVARVVAADLSALLGTPRVATMSLANFNPDYRVSLAVQRFTSVPGKSVSVEVLWVVRKPAGGVTFSGRTSADEPANGDYAALAAAHSRALAKVSSGIAAVIRSDAGAKP